jgi:diguanylate cyclase
MSTALGNHGSVTVREILVELDQALNDHMVWLKVWHRALLCAEAPGAREWSDAPGDLGRFGAWYVRNQHKGLVNQPAIRDLAGLHREMHERAHALVQVARAAASIPRKDYDAFMDTAAAFVIHTRRLEKAFARASSDLDPLTGLHNRQVMSRELERERARALRANRPCCFALADLDHFKAVNDTHGHAVGDRVLVAVAECFLSTLRPYDTIYRYGGEEFLLCLPDAPADIACRILERVLGELRAKSVTVREGLALSTTCSFGVAQVDPDATVEEIVKRADQALYRAKNEGRDRVCVWRGSAEAKTPSFSA